jgi:hypothetical protein
MKHLASFIYVLVGLAQPILWWAAYNALYKFSIKSGSEVGLSIVCIFSAFFCMIICGLCAANKEKLL